jgi:hypothetical protein
MSDRPIPALGSCPHCDSPIRHIGEGEIARRERAARWQAEMVASQVKANPTAA